MKIEKSTNILDQSGLTDSGEFTIEANAHAFQILSSGIYTNKLAAPFRELCCNAFDAQASVGNNAPIGITLPTKKNGYVFSVEDSGPGLSDQDIETGYSTYFKSSRNTSDMYTGGFGVGSKSPFAIVDSFTVCSRHGGFKTTYRAFLDGNKLPRIEQISKEPYSGTSGLTVSFDVPKNSVDEFIHQAEQVAFAFEQAYTLEPSTYKFKAQQDVSGIDYSRTRWPISRDYYASTKVLMGNICYPLKTFESKLDSSKGRDALYMWFCKRGVYMQVSVGSLNVAASREDLSYDRKTLTALPVLIEEEIKAFAQGIYAESMSGVTKLHGAEILRQKCNHEKLLENPEILALVAELGGWSEDVTRYVIGGLDGVLPEGVKVAKLHPHLEELPYMFEDMEIRSSHFGKKPARTGFSNAISGTPLQSVLQKIVSTIETTQSNPRKNTNWGYDGLHDMLHPALLSMLVHPLHKKGMYGGFRGHGEHAPEYLVIPEWDMAALQPDESQAKGRRFWHPGDIDGGDLNIPALGKLFSTLDARTTGKPDGRTNNSSRFSMRGRYEIADISILYPERTISKREFIEKLAEFNSSWGTNIEIPVISENDSELPPVVPERENTLRAMALANSPSTDGQYTNFGIQRVHLTEDELQKPFVYTTDDDAMHFSENDYLEELSHAMHCTIPIYYMDQKTLDVISSKSPMNGISLETFVDTVVLPWCMAAGIYELYGRHNSRTYAEAATHELLSALTKLPGAQNIAVLQNYAGDKAPHENIHQHTLRRLMDLVGKKLPEAPQLPQLLEIYPLLNIFTTTRPTQQEAEAALQYMLSIDKARELSNKMSQDAGNSHAP